jgi:hypothetical protein
MVMIIILGAIVAIAAAALAKYVMGRHAAQRAESWEGTVVSKDRSSPDGQNMYHYAMVKLADGTTKKAQINGSLWETLNEGDKLQKRAGEAEPTKAL